MRLKYEGVNFNFLIITDGSFSCIDASLLSCDGVLSSVLAQLIRLLVEARLFSVMIPSSSLPCLLFFMTKLPLLLSLLWLLLTPVTFCSLLTWLLGPGGLPSFRISLSLKISTSGPCISSSSLSSVSSFDAAFFLQQHLTIALQSLNDSNKGRKRKKTKLKRNSLALFRGLVTSLLRRKRRKTPWKR